MEMYIWNTVIVLSKIAFYVGFACIAGYTFFRQIFEQNESHNNSVIAQFKWIKTSMIVALVANAIWFFANTGSMVEEGIKGALDPGVIFILLGLLRERFRLWHHSHNLHRLFTKASS